MEVKLNNPFQKLKLIVTVFNETSVSLKKQLLAECAAVKLSGTKTISGYHNSLLFVLAYAENAELRDLAQKEMYRVCSKAAGKESFERSGIAFTSTQGAYSLTLVKWLIKNFPRQISLHSIDKAGVHPKEVFKHILPEMEFELLSDEKLNAEKWLKKASGLKKSSDILKWIADHMDKLNVDEVLKDQLYESLQLYINIHPKEEKFSRSFGNIGQDKIYYHDKGILKRFDERALIETKLPVPKKLSDKEKEKIIEVSRISLCLLNRETDPVTYCNNEGLLFYELEHGLSIALFGMLPERRLPLESYIGFVMFKNGYPMAYGGGWLFGKRSLLGINIFEAFRGGESAFVFAQLLRTYKQAFRAEYFEVEPYQFGKNNPEGLQSGAFWFYYRFGFRPVDKELNVLAEKEAEKIQNDKTYRSPISVLKLFTKSNVAVNFKPVEKVYNPSAISKYITAQIALQFRGDRTEAEEWGYKKIKSVLGIYLTKANATGLKKLALFIAFCIPGEKLSKTEKELLKNLIIEKGVSEFKYIALCGKLKNIKY